MPLAFVAFLLTAANVPAMDSFTLTLPQTIRAGVAQLALSSGGGAGNKKTHDRVLKLDPSNARLNGREIALGSKPGSSISFPANNEAAARLNKLGLDQEKAGDPCTAEDTFTQANSSANGASTQYLRNMGRAAYECGRYAYSTSEFSAAEDRDAGDLKADPDDADDINPDLFADREWLSLAYTASRQPQLASDACLRAHTSWKACRCTLKDERPSCAEVATRSPR
jgi:hypothetical protein